MGDGYREGGRDQTSGSLGSCYGWNHVPPKHMLKSWDFAGGPVVRTPRFHCRGHRFDPWSGNQDPSCHMEMFKS